MHRQHLSHLLIWIIASTPLSLFTSPACAQIIPDQTLSNPSNVELRGNRIEITGGTQSGSNLFHSFRAFSVPDGRTASFQDIDASVRNIFSRITGSSASRINGMIETLRRDGRVSSANFFLINPHGIIFGENASLNIGGSFLATTADRINFKDGIGFSATNPQTDPLLTVSVPVGLQFGRSPGRIVNRSHVDFNPDAPLLDSGGNALPAPFNDPDENPYEGLRVAPNQTIALLGGDVQFSGGELTAPGGHIEVSSVAASGLVRLIQSPEGWQFDYTDPQQFGDIQLLDADLNVSGERAGSIQLQGDRIRIANPNRGAIRAYTHDQNSGEIRIRGAHLTIEGEGLVLAETYGSGRGGSIRITADQLTVKDALISTGTHSLGQGGNIQITANQLVLADGGQIGANTDASGQGGNISMRVFGSIDIRDVVRLEDGEPYLDEGPIPSGVFARVGCSAEGCSQATGRGGNISIVAQRLRLVDGGQVSSDTYAVGNAGAITVRASSVEILGTVLDANGNSITSNTGRTAPSALSTIADGGATGNAGRIEIRTDRLKVGQGGTLQSSTLGSGDAGDLTVQATESIELIGVGAGTEVPAGLFSFSGGIPETNFEINRSATGRAGNLRVVTRSLMIRDNAVIAVGSANPNLDDRGRAGNLHIIADQVQADDRARLLANTNSGRGGDINLDISNLLLLNQNSQLSTTAGSERRGGNGGGITLDTTFLIASLNTNNDIAANAFTGNGGRITINAQSIIGLIPTDTLTPRRDPQSNITASSALGVNGEISINSPNVDPTRGLQLPEAPIDEPPLAQGCLPTTSAASDRSSFVISGRGGLPPSPDEFLGSDDLWQDWRLTDVEPEAESNRSATAVSTSNSQTAEIIEAQGWVRNAAGQVELVAQTPQPYSASSSQFLPNCSRVSHASPTR